jgi:DNA-directed RNA polymerase subunit H (RpoH/RPB5)
MTTKNSNSGLISFIYKSRKNILEVMDKQGYDIVNYSNFSINEVNSMTQSKQLDILLETYKDNINPKKMYIRYYLEKTLSQKIIDEMIDDLFNMEETLKKSDTLMIITKDDMNDTLTSILKHIWEKDKIFIVIQGIKRLQFNILEHSFVPSHRVLNNDEVEIIKKRYNIIDNTMFPDISRFDPVAKNIGIRPGEICEIIRPSKTAVNGYYYRRCV